MGACIMELLPSKDFSTHLTRKLLRALIRTVRLNPPCLSFAQESIQATLALTCVYYLPKGNPLHKTLNFFIAFQTPTY